MNTTDKPMGTDQAIRIANQVCSTWRQAIREGVDLEENKSVLVFDLDELAKALRVLSDWLY